jgi:hypothetical protein
MRVRAASSRFDFVVFLVAIKRVVTTNAGGTAEAEPFVLVG